MTNPAVPTHKQLGSRVDYLTRQDGQTIQTSGQQPSLDDCQVDQLCSLQRLVPGRVQGLSASRIWSVASDPLLRQPKATQNPPSTKPVPPHLQNQHVLVYRQY